MYYWGVNSKMQTSHTLCSRPKRYGALQTHRPKTTKALALFACSPKYRVDTEALLYKLKEKEKLNHIKVQGECEEYTP